MPGSYIRELGRTLHDARERKGVTLAEAQQATKIRQGFLQALEDENYAVLPPPVYIRGFLKNYANYLGIDSGEIVQRFDEILEAVAMGIDPYRAAADSGGADSGSADSGSADSGSTDSGGRLTLADTVPTSLSAPAVEIIKVGALEETAEILRVENAEEKKAVVEVETPKAEAPALIKPLQPRTKNTQALVPLRPNNTMNALRQPQRYVLKPSMAPLSKPAFYIPNFMPLLAVLIIIAAALLLLYRGVAIPVATDKSGPTATPNVFSAPTVTPLVGNNGNTGPSLVANSAKTNVATVAAPTPAPDPTMLANIAAGTTNTQTQASTTAAAPPSTTAPPVLQPVKVDLIINDSSSWVQVWVDDKPVLNRLGKSETLSYEGKVKVEIALGKPSAVKVMVNGVEKQYAAANSGSVVKGYFADGHEAITGR